jgi:hypothetical protein
VAVKVTAWPKTDGVTEVTAVAVATATYVKRSAATTGDVPERVVTVMSTGPTGSAGALAVICVAESTVKLVAASAPNLTAMTLVKFVPVILTAVPPVAGP